jgi:hypothetical protein
MTKQIRLCLALVTLGVAACDGSTDPGGPGTLTASIISPNGSEGAAILEVAGPVDTVTATSDSRVFSSVTPTGRRVIVVRGNPGNLSVKIRVPDVSRPPQVSIIEIADGDDRIRASLNGYRVEFD